MKRLYFVTPHEAITKEIVNELHSANITDADMHVVAGEGVNIPELPRATLLQTSDIVYASERGLVMGAVLGATVGLMIALSYVADLGSAATMTIIGALTGALFGGWAAGLIGSSTPNSHIRQFSPQIEGGRLLLMVDVPDRREREISDLVLRGHPDVSLKGSEHTLSLAA